MGRRKGKYTQATRCLLVLEDLQGHKAGRDMHDLAQEYGVTVKTLRRDLLAIEAADYALEYFERQARVKLLDSNMRSSQVTRRERYTLLAARGMFRVFHGTPFYDDAESVCTKVTELLPQTERAEYHAFGERIAYVPDSGTKSYADKEDVLDALQTGVMSDRVVKFTYRSGAAREQSGLLAPYAFAIYRQGLYVVGRRLGKLADASKLPPPGTLPRVFAVERFTDAEFIPRSTFARPSDFDLARLVDGAFGIIMGNPEKRTRVVIEFAKDRRSSLTARTWHPTQTITPLPDGGMRLEMQMTNVLEVLPWALSWGCHARVIEPRWLVARIAKEVQRAAAMYAAASASSPTAGDASDPQSDDEDDVAESA